MDFSFYLANYLESRILQKCKNMEIYIADNLESKLVELIVKDDAKEPANDFSLEISESFHDFIHHIGGNYKVLKHLGLTNLNIELPVASKKTPKLGRFHSLLAMAILQNPHVQITFTFISPKGEYSIQSNNIIQAFDSEELQQKKLLKYMNELLEEEINKLSLSL